MKIIKLFNNIDTVQGTCEECKEETILVAVVSDFYRCTNCGSDTKQYINGRIRYLQLSDEEKNFLKEHGKT
jgi:Zn finger protein HypA/HybF involved in hydrogenase expression|tara:strand:- start:837 stop:1049 length:213 start_codon:yes stop_codon:yes gene_type:complete